MGSYIIVLRTSVDSLIAVSFPAPTVFIKSLANDRHPSRRIKIFPQNVGEENIRAVQGGNFLFENSFESNSGHNKKVSVPSAPFSHLVR